MRRILIDRARHKQTRKAGGRRRRLDLDDIEPALVEGNEDRLLDLNEALTEFESEEPQKAELVKLRFFAGLSIAETAEVLDVSPATIERDWTVAKAWLHQRLSASL